MCTTEELTKIEHPTECPTPIGTPTDCLDDCWSPGVDDVDCPTGTVVIRELRSKFKFPAKIEMGFFSNISHQGQGFIHCKKSGTMPKPKFKMEKLCHGIYSIFGQYYSY